MATLSLRDAAQQTSTSKSTILRAIQRGKLSATRTDDGGWAIDPAELFRVYPPRNVAKQPGTVAARQDATAEYEVASKLLQQQLEALREMLRRADEEKDDLKNDRDKWRTQAERLALLAAPPTVAPAPLRPWWRRLAG